jgi:hypothetical protein
MGKKTGLWILSVILAVMGAGCVSKKDAPPQSAAQTPGAMDMSGDKIQAFDMAKFGKGDGAKVCPVSGDKIGEVGKPFILTMPDGKKIKLCCGGCVSAVRKNPAKYAAFFY